MTKCYYCDLEIKEKDAVYTTRSKDSKHKKIKLHGEICASKYLWYGWPQRILIKNGVI